jgi:hypothetical protein
MLKLKNNNIIECNTPEYNLIWYNSIYIYIKKKKRYNIL